MKPINVFCYASQNLEHSELFNALKTKTGFSSSLPPARVVLLHERMRGGGHFFR